MPNDIHRKPSLIPTSTLPSAVQQQQADASSYPSARRPSQPAFLTRLKSAASSSLSMLRNATLPAASPAQKHKASLLRHIDDWLQAAPPEHQASYCEIAAQLKACVNDSSITTLAIQNPHITGIPNCLPEHLSVLRLKNCHALETPPDVSHCPLLRELNLRHCNALRRGSDTSKCPQLEVLELGGPDSQLRVAPDVKHNPNLRVLNLRRSYQLLHGPDVTGCLNLERFDMHAVRVLAMPQGVFQLPTACEVTLDLEGLDSAEMGRAISQVHQNPNGPTITGLDAGLHVCAHSWLREAGLTENTELSHEQKTLWVSFSQNDPCNSFSVLLNRLRDIEDYRNNDTRAELAGRVAALLLKVQTNPELADICSAVAQLSVTACSDLVALGFLNIEMACVAHLTEAAVRRGECSAPELLAIGQGMHRLEQLEQLTQEKCRKFDGSRHIDATEVQLSYIVQLCREFKLPVQMREMLYPALGATAKDVGTAREMLRATGSMANDEHLMKFLIAWSPMDALFEREHPAQAQALKTSIRNEQNALRDELQTASNTDSGTYLAESQKLKWQFYAVHDDLLMQAKAPWIKSLMAAG
jgi:C-terminal novel E3 ligase, LRR-interacting